MATRMNDTETQSQCRNCGSFVTPQFARVYGNNDDEVHGCLRCQRARDLRAGNHLSPEHKRASGR